MRAPGRRLSVSVRARTERRLRVYALGPRRFFDSSWNSFEFILVALGLAGTLAASYADVGTLDRGAQFVRQVRMLRILNGLSTFKTLTETLTVLLPAVVPGVGVMLIFFYIFSVSAVGLWHDVRLPDEEYHANDFRDFAAAMLTSFQLMVVNDWNKTMERKSTPPPS